MWVIGDSFVHWASRIAVRDATLIPGLKVQWFGRRGLHIEQFGDFLQHTWSRENSNPDAIIIHVGSNDLGKVPKKCMLHDIHRLLSGTRELLPHAIIFWSEILPRVAYTGAIKQNKVERARRAINRNVGGLFRSSPGGLINHPQIVWSNRDLFIHDGIHLSDTACHFLISNFNDALRTLFP